MINRIVIDKDKIFEYNKDLCKVEGNIINFTNNGEYVLDIVNSKNVDIILNILDNVCVKLFIYSDMGDYNNKILYKLGENSNLILFKFYNNNRIDSVEEIYLDGKYSKISYNFSGICRGSENYKIRVFHNNNCVDSNINNRFIGLDNSKIVIDIDSILDKGNVGVSMDQDTKVMCMGDVRADIRPNMFIEEDDVVARHGSVIGRFSDDNKFYLMSRGISEEEAIGLMVKGFILSNMVVDMESRSKMLGCVNKLFG